MTNNNAKTSTMRKREMLAVAILAMAAGVNSLSVANTRRRQRSSALHYRGDQVTIETTTLPLTNPLIPSTIVQSDLSDFQQSLEEDPISYQKQLEENMEKLRQTMSNSFYTESEILKLNFAIEEAAVGDTKLMSEVADLCHILADTMDMGINVLIAAAFHYCQNDDGVDEFGEQVVELFQNANSLKKLQTVFSSIVHHTSGMARWDHLRNLLLTDTRDWRALAIRSAACLHLLRQDEDKKSAREALYTFAPLASRLGMHRLKNELEGDAFRTLYRRQYETVSSLSSEVKSNGNSTIAESMEQVLKSVKKDIESVLASDTVFCSTTESFEVTARVKEPYSMWKKMLRQGSDHVLDVPDAIAFRVVLKAKKLSEDEPEQVSQARERALCYYAQHLCQQSWAPLKDNPRLKDYIENPKPNGYQSLHYTASNQWKGERWTMEIQVRSEEMHKVAEYGLAAHWDYKSGSSDNKDYSSDAYLASLQEWHWEQANLWNARYDLETANDPFNVENVERNDFIQNRAKHLEPYLEALNKAKLTLEEQYKFVFINSGEGNLIALPAEASVYDALEENERQTGQQYSGGALLLNGMYVKDLKTSSLENGDVLTLQL